VAKKGENQQRRTKFNGRRTPPPHTAGESRENEKETWGKKKTKRMDEAKAGKEKNFDRKNRKPERTPKTKMEKRIESPGGGRNESEPSRRGEICLQEQ